MKDIKTFYERSGDYVAGYIDEKEAYRRGYDCGRNGANDWNSNFKIFSSPENTKAWERGNKDGKTKTPQP